MVIKDKSGRETALSSKTIVEKELYYDGKLNKLDKSIRALVSDPAKYFAVSGYAAKEFSAIAVEKSIKKDMEKYKKFLWKKQK